MVGCRHVVDMHLFIQRPENERFLQCSDKKILLHLTIATVWFVILYWLSGVDLWQQFVQFLTVFKSIRSEHRECEHKGDRPVLLIYCNTWNQRSYIMKVLPARPSSYLEKAGHFSFFPNVSFGKMPHRRRKKRLQNLATGTKTGWTDEEGCRSEEEDVFDVEVNSQVSSCSRILDCDRLKNWINQKVLLITRTIGNFLNWSFQLDFHP